MAFTAASSFHKSKPLIRHHMDILNCSEYRKQSIKYFHFRGIASSKRVGINSVRPESPLAASFHKRMTESSTGSKCSSDTGLTIHCTVVPQFSQVHRGYHPRNIFSTPDLIYQLFRDRGQYSDVPRPYEGAFSWSFPQLCSHLDSRPTSKCQVASVSSLWAPISCQLWK